MPNLRLLLERPRLILLSEGKLAEEIDPSDELRSRWENILLDADIQSVPIHLLKEISILMSNGETKIFEVKNYFDKGLTSNEVEVLVENFIQEYDDEIESLDFHLNIEALAEEVSEKTKRLLG